MSTGYNPDSHHYGIPCPTRDLPGQPVGATNPWPPSGWRHAVPVALGPPRRPPVKGKFLTEHQMNVGTLVDVNTAGLDRTVEVCLVEVDCPNCSHFSASTSSWKCATVSINTAAGDRTGSYPFTLLGSPPRDPESVMSTKPSLNWLSLGGVPVPGSCLSDTLGSASRKRIGPMRPHRLCPGNRSVPARYRIRRAR